MEKEPEEKVELTEEELAVEKLNEEIRKREEDKQVLPGAVPGQLDTRSLPH